MNKETLNYLTIKEMQKQDLCIHDGDAVLYDDVYEYLEHEINALPYKVPEADKEDLIFRMKQVPLYKKKYFQLPKGFLMEEIEEYMYDNWDCEEPDCYIRKREIIEKAEEEFNKVQTGFYHKHNEIIAYIDLSQQVEEMLQSYE